MSREGLFRAIVFPGALLMTMIAFVVVYRALGLPSTEELVASAQQFYVDYGILVVFVAAVVEGMLGINWYLPGSAIVALGVVLRAGDPIGATIVVVVASLGFITAYLLDYLMGKLAWYPFLSWLGIDTPLHRMRDKVEARGPQILLSACVHPNLGALAATSAGILRLDVWKFILLVTLGTVFWNTLWGVIVYYVGEPFIHVAGMWVLVFLAAIWLVWSAVRWFLLSIKGD